MIKITNGVNEFLVPEGAYEHMFKQQGYTIVGDEQEVEAEVETEAEIEGFQSDEVEAETDKLDEKPVSQWSKQELKFYCDKHEISLEGVARTEDVRERVLKFQEQNLTEE